MLSEIKKVSDCYSAHTQHEPETALRVWRASMTWGHSLMGTKLKQLKEELWSPDFLWSGLSYSGIKLCISEIHFHNYLTLHFGHS